MYKLYNWYVICLIFSWSYTIWLHAQYIISSTIDHYLRKLNQLHAHIKTIKIHTYEHNNLWERLKLKTPNYMYIICHRDHVTIIIQSLSQALSISNRYTLIRSQSRKSMHRSLPPASLPLLRNHCWRMALNELELVQPCSRNPHWNLH